MLVLVLACIGVSLVVAEILISEFNDGNHSNFASWVAGAYVTVGTVCLIGGAVSDLCSMLSAHHYDPDRETDSEDEPCRTNAALKGA